MCGIVGFVNLKQNSNKEKCKHILSNMTKKISGRGPDEDGYYIKDNICLGHKRLIVVDPEGGKQPMTCKMHNNSYTLVYNGQLYNTKELRKELQENGFSFEENSDTEVLLKSYIHWGYDVVHKLNGIFGFAIWDENKQELFIARDHFGIKPLYYTRFEDHFIFASEVKCILEFPRN